MPADPKEQPSHPTSATPQRVLWGVLILVLVGVGIFSAYSWLKHEELKTATRTLPDYGKVPQFTLTSQDNAPVSLADLKGHIWVADLIYTHCSGSCPMITSRLASIQKSLFKTPDVKLVSISIDPDHDTPQALSDYAKMTDADTKQWTFLTGNRSTIVNLAQKGFHVEVDSVADSTTGLIAHTDKFILIDAAGSIRGYYDGTTDDAQSKVLMDVGELMREKKS